jgi:uncharacterized protein (DUF427 family)
MGLSWQQRPLGAGPVGRFLTPERLPQRLLLPNRSGAAGAWRYTAPDEHAGELRDRVGFAWRAMDAFYEEDERIVGHAADPYHRIDIRRTSRQLVVRDGDRVVADTTRPGQTVMPHGIDRGLDPDEIVHRAVGVTPALGPLPPVLVRSRLDSKPEH